MVFLFVHKKNCFTLRHTDKQPHNMRPYLLITHSFSVGLTSPYSLALATSMNIFNTHSKTISLFLCFFFQDTLLPVLTPSHTQELFGLSHGLPNCAIKELSGRPLRLYWFGFSFKVSTEVDWHHFASPMGEKLSHWLKKWLAKSGHNPRILVSLESLSSDA